MTARRRRTTAPDRAVLDGDSPSRRNDGMLSRPHDLRPHFRQSCEAPLRRSPEEDAVFCFDNHRCGLRPPRQAKDFEPGRCRIRFPSEHIRHTMPASSTPAGIVRRHRRTGRSPTPPRRKEQKHSPKNKAQATAFVRPNTGSPARSDMRSFPVLRSISQIVVSEIQKGICPRSR